MFVEFWTSNNIRIQVLEVNVLINYKAFIQAYLFLPTGLTLLKLDMTELEYKEWGSDDNYIKHFICSKMKDILGHPIEGQPIEGAAITALQPVQDDSRSVHNESDLNRITTLEQELEEQKKKLATILSLIGKQTI